MKSRIALAAALAFAVILSGCGSLSAFIAPAAQPLEQAAIAAAVYTTVTANKADVATQQARAGKINAIAREVLALDQGSSMALADIQIIVNAKIAALNLPAPDALLAAGLAAALGQAVTAQLAITTKGAISPQTQVAIAAVCSWIITDTGG